MSKKESLFKLHLGCGCAHNGSAELFEFCYYAVLDYLNEKNSQFTFSTKIYWRTQKIHHLLGNTAHNQEHDG